MMAAADAIQRFAAILDTLVPPGERIGFAVSGGPDSLAMLLLAAAARPGVVEAATVDHGLRAEAADEAAMVAALCEKVGVPHETLMADWAARPTANIQAEARAMRYRLLGDWAARRGIRYLATAHHADDQAETLLMRLARGAGLAGLAGIRSSRALDNGVWLIRPLLGWRKDELVAIVEEAGETAVDDPSNRDDAYDRTRARRLLAQTEWLPPERLAASASALADCDEALDWMVANLAAERIADQGGQLSVDPSGLPRELVRRLLLHAFERMGASPPRGPDLDRAMAALSEGRSASLSGLLLRPGTPWSIAPEPPRNR